MNIVFVIPAQAGMTVTAVGSTGSLIVDWSAAAHRSWHGIHPEWFIGFFQVTIMQYFGSSRFSASVVKDSLVFSAAHFITFNGNICERLHGHNWRVAAAVDGNLDENGYVYDFIAIRDGLQSIVAELDHRVLLPDCHPAIKVTVSADGKEVQAAFEDRRWLFPREDCCILPVSNTTAELIAHWIGQLLMEKLKLPSTRVDDTGPVNVQPGEGLTMLRVSVEENFGQWAECRIPLINPGS
jgi:6-pyruvoyltetrahydropterin/6-carboxytetrahydropterin synthase